MEFFGNIIKGIMIGIANIIPGVSGGTMAVSLGIYDRLIGSISGLFREFKKSILFLIPIIIGAGIGIVGFTYAIEYLLDKHTFVTCMAFVGLILGGLPAIFSSMRAKVSSGGFYRRTIYGEATISAPLAEGRAINRRRHSLMRMSAMDQSIYRVCRTCAARSG